MTAFEEYITREIFCPQGAGIRSYRSNWPWDEKPIGQEEIIALQPQPDGKALTVSELIAKLSHFPPDMKVHYYYDGGISHSGIQSVHPSIDGDQSQHEEYGDHVLLCDGTYRLKTSSI